MISIKDRIDAKIDENRNAMIEDIMQLVKYKSINKRQDENRACLQFFLNKAGLMGFKTMSTSAFDTGIVEYGEGEETLGILVHLDVVEIGDPGKWTVDPFKGEIRDGYLWGRGTVDDKGAAVMSLYAMKAVKDLKLPMNRKIWLIAGTSEESEWTDIENFKREFPVPDFGFSPDGEFPVYYAEKGYADVKLLFPRDAVKEIVSLSGGDSYNTIPSKAEISFENGEIIAADGISGHSSAPELADNAIIKLCKIIADKKQLDFADFINDYFSDSSNGRRLMIDDGSDAYKGEYTGFTTAAPTFISIGEEGVQAIINIRHKFGTTNEEITDAFVKLQDKYGYKCSVSNYLKPMMISKELPFLKIMNDVYEEYGFKGEFKAAAGTSYAKSMDNFVSWGPVFPNDPLCAHMEDERLSISSMLAAAKIYGLFIARIGGNIG